MLKHVKLLYKGRCEPPLNLRHAAQIPAIIYGGSAEPVTITLELRQIVKALENNAFEEVIEIKSVTKLKTLKSKRYNVTQLKHLCADFKRA